MKNKNHSFVEETAFISAVHTHAWFGCAAGELVVPRWWTTKLLLSNAQHFASIQWLIVVHRIRISHWIQNNPSERNEIEKKQYQKPWENTRKSDSPQDNHFIFLLSSTRIGLLKYETQPNTMRITWNLIIVGEHKSQKPVRRTVEMRKRNNSKKKTGILLFKFLASPNWNI